MLDTAQKKRQFFVRCRDGSGYKLEHVNKRPKHLILYNGQGIATCSDNYTPIVNEKLKERVVSVLQTMDLKPLEIQEENPKEFQWRATFILEKNYEIPIGHFRQGERFDWGLGITNSYDLSKGINVMYYAKRLICSNGLYAWDTLNKKRFIHIEKEKNEETILSKIEEGVQSVVSGAQTFFKNLEVMSLITPSNEQAFHLIKRLSIRKYEAAILEDHGVSVEFDKGDIKEVKLISSKVPSEYHLLNAITAMSNDVNTTARMFDLQTGLMEKIMEARTIIPDL